jgi:2-keto-4-pentenoate hydratase/2-oxohepta-3-ene-1,7-dioic acid hydratase in catechol pathway
MKLVRFSTTPTTQPMIGITDGMGVSALAAAVPEAPTDVISLIEGWPRFHTRIAGLPNFDLELAEVCLHAPIARPGKIYAIGLNYADHAAEGGLEPSKEQVWFTKPGTAVNGPYDPIERPRVSTQLDYEAELVVVIGRRARHLTRSEALSAVFGYCVGNDVSVRDWQVKTSQVTLGKSFDTHAPFGPWIVTADVLDPSDLAIWTLVNGQERQRSRTRNLIFDVAAQISHLSEAMTLEPGDVIFTGTPAGVGAARKPPVWLEPGDRVRIAIEGIGHIENVVVDEQPRAAQ